MGTENILGNFPPMLLVGRESTQYLLSTLQCAVKRSELSDASQFGQLTVADRNELYLLVHPDDVQSCQTVFPVYLNGVEVAVATGKLFIQLSPGTQLEGTQETLQMLGFRLLKVLSYAPHSGWIQDAEDNVKRSLRRMDVLDVLQPQVLEPQLLRPGRERVHQ